jgi:hypothetical protein
VAAGRYISWLSHDDVFAPSKLEKQVAALERLPGPAVCYTDVEMIDAEGKVTSERRLPEYAPGRALLHVLTGGEIGLASYSICYDRRCIEEVGFYSERWRYTQDAEMLMRLARRYPLVHVPELLMQVREHDVRGIRSENWEREVVRFYREHLASTPFAELFPEMGAEATRVERSEACMGVGDTFAAKPFPLYRVAYAQYRRALGENPADAPRLLRRMAGLYWRRRKENSRS